MNKLIYTLSPILAILTNLTITLLKYKTVIENPIIRNTLKEEIFSWETILAVITLTATYIVFFVCLHLIIHHNEEKKNVTETPAED